LSDDRTSPPTTAPIPLGRAYDTLDRIQAALQTVADVAWMSPAGAVRRGLDLVDGVELLVATDHHERVREAVAPLAVDSRVHESDGNLLTLEIERVATSIRCIPAEGAGAELLHATGSSTHLAALRARARERGHVLDRNGLRSRDGATSIASSEESIYASLGLPFIPPELRNGDDEFVAAERGALPRLVSTGDIRGDLHVHSLWSDGRDTVEAMVVSAIALGYEYIAITDHSPSSAASRNLTIDGVARQAEEIANIRTMYPQIAVLHGCEVDILEDGSLDFTDVVLERFDIVLASLHESHGQDPRTLLRRYERAMRHPLVTLITHPTNRLFPYRPGYDLDYDRLFQLATETGTLLEIDGAPSHMDLDASLARRAVRAGVTLSIDSDCHIAARLGRQMYMGVVTARRGWVETERVLNAKPLAEVQARIASKRTGKAG
jgi:DNA polymerase (family 10)